MLRVGHVGCSEGEAVGAQPRLVNAAHEFEAEMMKELIRPMTRLDDDDDGVGAGGALRDLAGEMLGQSLSRAGGFGIASRVIRSFSQSETSCEAGSGIRNLPDSNSFRLKQFSGPPMNLLRRVMYGDSEQR